MNEIHEPSADSTGDDLDTLISELSANPGTRAIYDDAEERRRLILSLVSQRQASKLSQAELAKELGIPQSALSDFEAGRLDPNLSTVQRYARALNMRLQFHFVPGE